MTTTRYLAAAAVAIATQLAGCSDDTRLAEAQKTIARLELELAELKKTKPVSEHPAGPTSATVAAPVKAPTVAPVPSTWEYDSSEDKMSGKAFYVARTSSLNTVNFGFPYAGEQNGTLRLRVHPTQGKEVMFSIEKGQILCQSYKDCSVQVRFDDDKAQTYSAIAPSDGSKEIIFLRNYGKFATRLKTAKRVRLSVDIYHQGRPVFEFDVGGLDFTQLAAKP